MLSRKVDECKPLVLGGIAQRRAPDGSQGRGLHSSTYQLNASTFEGYLVYRLQYMLGHNSSQSGHTTAR